MKGFKAQDVLLAILTSEDIVLKPLFLAVEVELFPSYFVFIHICWVVRDFWGGSPHSNFGLGMYKPIQHFGLGVYNPLQRFWAGDVQVPSAFLG